VCESRLPGGLPVVMMLPEQQVQYMLDDRMIVIKAPDYGGQFEVALKDNLEDDLLGRSLFNHP
jgi:hypothetical protein